MVSKKMQEVLSGSSAIRKMFEEGAKMSEIYGRENVYDFSLGNPNLAPPIAVKDAIVDVLENDLPTLVHGYMNNAGYDDVRETVANSINKRFDTKFTSKNIIMTVGAAGGINVIFKTFLDADDEVVVFAPYFAEYKHYVENFGGKLVVVPPNIPSFLPDVNEIKKYITKKTKAVIINTPNNPTGVIYSEDLIKEICALLDEKQKEFGTEIYLVADEPYRELVYDKGVNVPYITKYYNNTIVAYSWSKSLSLPGERIGYLVVPSELADFDVAIDAMPTALRILGFVNAPSLIQRAVAKCIDTTGDIEFYNKNRTMLYDGLTEIGYDCVKPDGAFYLWVKSPFEDDLKFVEMAKKYQILVVTGGAFGCSGYVRIVYCVSPDMIEKSLPKFKELWEEIQNTKQIL